MEQARLEYTDASGRAQVVAVEASPFKIGRSTSNDLPIGSAEVSRDHAEIHWVDDHYVVRDRESRAGTFVNDRPVKEQPLRGGDRIRVGPTVLVFKLGRKHDDDSQSSSSTTAITDLRQTANVLESMRERGSERMLDHVLDLVLDSAIEISGAERGFLVLVGADDQRLEFKRGRSHDKRSLSPGDLNRSSRKIPRRVFRTGKTELVEDLFESDVAPDHDATVKMRIRTVLCAPLRAVRYLEAGDAPSDDSCIGVLYLDSQERRSFSSSAILASLETLANEAAGAIENARLYRDSQEKQRLEHDLQTAKEFQQALLPKAPPDLGFFDAAAMMVPCRMIGGDFYEYVALEDGALGFTLGDVAGKGAPAGLLGARIQEIFSANAPTLVEPAATISRINGVLLRKSLESRFVTMVYGLLYPDGTLRYCNAGHNHPVLFTADGVRRLESGGLIVGLFDDATWQEETVRLAPGDLLVIFSDGISEATRGEEEFGDDRIIRSVETVSGERRPDTVLQHLFADLHAFTVDALQGDDMTALVLRYDP